MEVGFAILMLNLEHLKHTIAIFVTTQDVLNRENLHPAMAAGFVPIIANPKHLMSMLNIVKDETVDGQNAGELILSSD